MRVTVKTSFGVAVVLVVAGEVPDDESLVTATREKHIWAAMLLDSASRIAFAHDTDFSRDVAKLVTHPLWPSRVPRITNCSAMLGRYLKEQ